MAHGDAGSAGGAVWILFLGRDSRVLRHTKIPLTHGGSYRHSLARLGDLDGDGVTELAEGVTANAAITPDFAAVEIFFLRPDGSVKATQEILPTDPPFVPRIRGVYLGYFAAALAGLGDVDGDGVGDLAIGAPYDNDGVGTYNGAAAMHPAWPTSPDSARRSRGFRLRRASSWSMRRRAHGSSSSSLPMPARPFPSSCPCRPT